MARILIVEDNDPIRWALANLLQIEGYEVDQVADGRQALARISSRSFDLVLMDVYMPQMDALEVCRRLHQESQAPIVMISGTYLPAIRDQAFACGASAFLPKPLEFQSLLDLVRKVTRGHPGSTGKGFLELHD
jgi:two-component system response regulator ResD